MMQRIISTKGEVYISCCGNNITDRIMVAGRPTSAGGDSSSGNNKHISSGEVQAAFY
jgi:hypothetical protein